MGPFGSCGWVCPRLPKTWTPGTNRKVLCARLCYVALFPSLSRQGSALQNERSASARKGL
ncbi:hypothetical protein JMJ77_0001673 [Colletotrichum scovillei]|uniref:Uncharacterized protein n=1 Tax=Colletotrichum scovillei TaxID=1209932 RepID=A0A9P7R7K7_9PEZI|nr:hypothetical protein JMJ77_0001673 [Colletotrichum scovillei]KAG7070083.1 hypothetical protein JMJ76_0001340 [Colletotrichum scovillei]KAG7078331.1 hypothetical protein JMJ78_0002003 [Colletotrichum scovillei]